MPYVARHLICHPLYTCAQGKTVIGCPPLLLAQLIKDKIVVLEAGVDGEDDIPQQLIEDQDNLSTFTQKELVAIIKLNQLQGICRPMSNWTLDQIRQCIRDAVGNVTTLKFPGENPLIPEGNLDAPDLSGTNPDETKRFAS